MPKEVENPKETRAYSHPGYKIAAAVVALILVFGVFVVGAIAGRASGDRFMGWHNSITIKPGPAMMQRRGVSQGGLFSTTNHISGVVTAVNGDSLTVAGNGATNTVTTNSSTQYQGGGSVKINDTVIAFGSTSSNTFTATEVDINP